MSVEASSHLFKCYGGPLKVNFPSGAELRSNNKTIGVMVSNAYSYWPQQKEYTDPSANTTCIISRILFCLVY